MEGFMSKHLVKILSTFALVILLPLIVVGAALCVTEAVPVDLTIFLGGEEYSAEGQNVTATIKVDGEESDVEFGETITIKKNSEIILTYSFSTNSVYEFYGWYQGTSSQINDDSEALSTENGYTFTIRENQNITLLKNLKQFKVEYTGFYDDEVTPINESEVVKYGSELYSLVPQAGGTFAGWRIKDENASLVAYVNATFDIANRDQNGELATITLEPVWADRMVVTYYDVDRTTVIDQDIVTSNNYSSYQVLSGNSEEVAGYIDAGYEFNAWFSEDGEAVVGQIPFTEGYVNLYLSLEELDHTTISYYTSISDGSLIAQDVLYKDEFAEYQLRTATGDVANAIPNGYRFNGWTDISGSNFTQENLLFIDGEYRLYMNLSIIDYNVQVQFNAIDTNIVDSMTFNVEDDFSSYTRSRFGYEFVGLSYNGNTYVRSGNDYLYNGSSLGDIVVANNGLTVVAVWAVDEATYPTLTWNFGFTYEGDNGLFGVYSFDGTSYSFIDITESEIVYFEDQIGIGSKQLEDNILETYFPGININNLYALVDGSYVHVTLDRIEVLVDDMPSGGVFSGDDMENVTFIDLYDAADMFLADDSSTMRVRFYFVR